jgi:hypothetical protein
VEALTAGAGEGAGAEATGDQAPFSFPHGTLSRGSDLRSRGATAAGLRKNEREQSPFPGHVRWDRPLCLIGQRRSRGCRRKGSWERKFLFSPAAVHGAAAGEGKRVTAAMGHTGKVTRWAKWL